MAGFSLSGIASGLDTKGLIKSLLDTERRSRISPLEDKVAAAKESVSAFGDLKSKLEKLRLTADKFRALSGGVISKNAISSNENVLTASATNGSEITASSFTVISTAKAGSFSFNDRFGSRESVINSNIDNGADPALRTVTFAVGSSESVAIPLSNSTTLSEFVDSFNSQSTLATASLVNVGSTSTPSYALKISAKNSGTETGSITLTSVGSAISGAGSFLSSTTVTATDARLTVDGIDGEIVRGTNTISDLISGTTLTLKGIGSASVSVEPESSEAADLISTFVSEYNSLVRFAKESDSITSQSGENGDINTFGPLSETNLDESLITSLRGVISTTNNGTSSLVRVLSDVGITTERDGTLKLDSSKLLSSLESNSQEVGSLFEKLGDSLADPISGIIPLYNRFNGNIDNAIKSSQSLIDANTKRINDLESALAKQEEALKGRYSRLESLMGKLQAQQSALGSLLKF